MAGALITIHNFGEDASSHGLGGKREFRVMRRTSRSVTKTQVGIGLLETILLEWAPCATGVVLHEGIATGATYILQLLHFLENNKRHQEVLK